MALSDSHALAKAQTIWGSPAMIGKVRGVSDTYWITQVGYRDNNGDFAVIGEGSNTFDDAFAKMTGLIKIGISEIPSPAGDSEIKGYNLYCSDNVTGPYLKVNTDLVLIRKYDLTFKPSGTGKKFYTVKAVDVFGAEGQPSSAVEA